MGKRKNVMARIFIPLCKKSQEKNGFFHRALECLCRASSGHCRGQHRAWPGHTCRCFTQVPAKATPAHGAHYTTPAYPGGIGPSTFLLNPIITKPLQLQLNKTGIFHCCKIFYFLTGDVGTSNPVCSQAEQDGRTPSSEGN